MRRGTEAPGGPRAKGEPARTAGGTLIDVAAVSPGAIEGTVHDPAGAPERGALPVGPSSAMPMRRTMSELGLALAVTLCASCGKSHTPASARPAPTPTSCAGALGERAEPPPEMSRGRDWPVVHIAASGDGRCVYAITEIGELLIWNVGASELRRWKKRTIALAPGGNWALTEVDRVDPERYPPDSAGHSVELWNLSTGTRTASVEFHWNDGIQARVSADGTHAILHDEELEKRVGWNTASGVLTDLDDHDWQSSRYWLLEWRSGQRSNRLAFLPDGSSALIPVMDDDDERLALWELDGKGPRLVPVQLPENFVVTATAVLPDGTGAVVAGGRLTTRGHPPWPEVEDGTLLAISLPTGEVRELASNLREAPQAVVLDPSGKTAITISSDRARAWDLETASEVKLLLDEATSAAFAADRRLLAVGGKNGQLRIWDLVGDKLVASINMPTAHLGRVSSLAVFGDGRLAASGGEDQTFRVWSLGDGRLVKVVKSSYGGQTVAVSGDGSRMYVTRSDGVDVLDTTSWNAIGALRTPGPVQAVAASTDSSLVLTAGGGQSQMTAWDRDGRAIWSEWAQGSCAALSADGRSALAMRGQKIVLLDAATGAARAELQPSSDGSSVYTCAFSPDGRIAATGGSNVPISLWDVSTGTLLRSTPVREYIQSIAFSADGKLIATVEPMPDLSPTDPVRVRRVADLTESRTYQVVAPTVVAFTPRGELLVGTAGGVIETFRKPAQP